ncbi:26.5 kDa heat shock protein, mitochondrial isoform X2 [Ricinus communis]|uniref:26.5 kDa heat shock protein, mitochondrial isoform X2 n=1 Tax=Ricinus communis TaxID=3988 RepID=UPI000772329B|nr:26.5 kDa heat shock protein, mitochondrial isoform X2 [Ricinus communis]|eukprot:XP_015573812.1 26.5 kDa heat shock protein, mitochondrial isoform X2 [Ricinus communis]
MAFARLALRSLSQRVSSSASSLVGHGVIERSVGDGVQSQRWNRELLKRFMATASGEASDGKEVAVSERDNKKSKLFSKKKGKRGLWRRNGGEFVPQLYGLGNALLQATENINRLFENLNLSPSNLMRRLKEKEECYKLRYEVPGVTKEDLKITVDDGVLTIKGEHKEEEEEEGSDDEHWSMRSYGYYNTSVLLPDDAKADEIKAELKNGVLHITIPRTEQPKKDVKEVQIH